MITAESFLGLGDSLCLSGFGSTLLGLGLASFLASLLGFDGFRLLGSGLLCLSGGSGDLSRGGWLGRGGSLLDLGDLWLCNLSFGGFGLGFAS